MEVKLQSFLSDMALVFDFSKSDNRIIRINLEKIYSVLSWKYSVKFTANINNIHEPDRKSMFFPYNTVNLDKPLLEYFLCFIHCVRTVKYITQYNTKRYACHFAVRTRHRAHYVFLGLYFYLPEFRYNISFCYCHNYHQLLFAVLSVLFSLRLCFFNLYFRHFSLIFAPKKLSALFVVKVKFCYYYVTWINWSLNILARNFFHLGAVNVNLQCFHINARYFSFHAFETAAHYHYLIALSNRDRALAIILAQEFVQVCMHKTASHMHRRVVPIFALFSRLLARVPLY